MLAIANLVAVGYEDWAQREQKEICFTKDHLYGRVFRFFPSSHSDIA
jgi:hypothetical protein